MVGFMSTKTVKRPEIDHILSSRISLIIRWGIYGLFVLNVLGAIVLYRLTEAL